MGKKVKLALTINIIFFVLIMIVHVYRIFTGFHAQFGSWVVPIWLNIVAVIILLLLIYLNYKAL